jgi:hypothetical protein
VSSPTDRVRLGGLRGRIIEEVANSLTSAVMDPDSDLGPAGLLAYEKTLEAVEALMVASHGGNRGYEERDLPPEQRVEYRRAVHALNVLKRLRVE